MYIKPRSKLDVRLMIFLLKALMVRIFSLDFGKKITLHKYEFFNALQQIPFIISTQ